LHAAAFDERAAGYDADFTNTPLGSALRTLVWARLDRLFTGAQRVLDLGCGTGEDAVYLAARGTRVLGRDSRRLGHCVASHFRLRSSRKWAVKDSNLRPWD